MRALITGISGQDGRFLTRELINEGVEVFGTARKILPKDNKDVFEDLQFAKIETLDHGSFADIQKVLDRIQPDYIYNLAGLSSVKKSFYNFDETMSANFVFFEKLVRAVTSIGLANKTRIYQASSSEMFGQIIESPQNEKSELNPISPYGYAKVASHLLSKFYRTTEDVFISTGIMYNHESEKRPPKFVSRKISKRVAEIRLGIENELILGDLNARRDWGFAGDYVSAMIKIVNYEIPTDFVISTGKAHSVLDFVREAFIAAGMSGEENKFLKNSPDHERKRDHRNLVGDPTKARELLNWKPSLTFSDLVHRMVKFDLAEVELRNQM